MTQPTSKHWMKIFEKQKILLYLSSYSNISTNFWTLFKSANITKQNTWQWDINKLLDNNKRGLHFIRCVFTLKSVMNESKYAYCCIPDDYINEILNRHPSLSEINLSYWGRNIPGELCQYSDCLSFQIIRTHFIDYNGKLILAFHEEGLQLT